MINIRMTKLAIFPLAVFLLTTPLTSIAKTFSAKVVRVIDGDTVQAYDGAINTRVRLENGKYPTLSLFFELA